MRVAYYYDRTCSPSIPSCTSLLNITTAADIGVFTYGLGHPMKPQRMRLTHELVSAYGMLEHMQILVSLSLFFTFPPHVELMDHSYMCIETETSFC